MISFIPIDKNNICKINHINKTSRPILIVFSNLLFILSTLQYTFTVDSVNIIVDNVETDVVNVY